MQKYQFSREVRITVQAIYAPRHVAGKHDVPAERRGLRIEQRLRRGTETPPCYDESQPLARRYYLKRVSSCKATSRLRDSLLFAPAAGLCKPPIKAAGRMMPVHRSLPREKREAGSLQNVEVHKGGNAGLSSLSPQPVIVLFNSHFVSYHCLPCV